MQRQKFILKISLIALILFSLPTAITAQSLDSTNYTLVEPTIGPAQGNFDSTNYSILVDTSVGNFTSTSTNYQVRGGTAEFIEANVPQVICFETTTDSGSTSCTGVPGSDGMQAVCGNQGCYNRAKIEIDAQNNPDDARYAIQISTTSDFSSNVFYVDATTRFLKASLTVADFVPKCEWEGTTSGSICPSPNTTWQRYNILGLDTGTQYYVRVSAMHGSDTDGSFTQSEWSPSANATTTTPQISLDVDIAPTTAGSSNAPYILDIGNFPVATVATSSDMVIFRLSTNAITGVETLLSGLNGELRHTVSSDPIDSVNGDLAVLSAGYGLRNDSGSNSAQNTGTIGDITVSSTPSDFTDTGGADEVGEVPVTPVLLFSSNGLPLDTGVTGYHAKVKASVDLPAGSYSEIITFIVVGEF